MKIAILASGSGTNAQAIFERINSGSLTASATVLISDNPQAKALERASRAGVKTAVIERKNYPDRAAFDSAVTEALLRSGCDLVVLAGYMRIVGEPFFAAFRNRMINLHPALLPAFPGLNGIGDAFDYGVKLTGASVHFVVPEVDAGPLIIQGGLPVGASEAELASRIHQLEHRILPQAIQWFAEGRLAVKGRKVELSQAAKALAEPEPDCLIWPPLEQGF
ncbi:MAG: phosphoribosylglycinamide formyltransferase [Desulfovibrio sp.]|nr:phosphoribosylglycinamide formyltransferase [Desulfovibrio sp.]